jgi:hypothetical protein
MNWSKALLSGVAGGIAVTLYNTLMHGFIMANAYSKVPSFRADANPAFFAVLAVLIGIVGGILFAKTRASWSAGPKGGMNFGLWMGLIAFLAAFFLPLTQKDFPYYLTWCMGSIDLIGWVVFGAVAGALNKG